MSVLRERPGQRFGCRVSTQSFRLLTLTLSMAFLLACKTFMQEGSVYKKTGRVSDLLTEPTFKPNYDLSLAGPLYDADGHGVFDAPVVLLEKAVVSPLVILGAPFSIPAVHNVFVPVDEETATESACRYALSVVVVPYACVWLAAVAADLLALGIMDIPIHDVPVIVIGKPVKKLGELVKGRNTDKAQPPDSKSSSQNEAKKGD